MGVFLTLDFVIGMCVGIPHARGGVSVPLKWLRKPDEYSPRPWGCFLDAYLKFMSPPVFPTPVGVFLEGKDLHAGEYGIPHARGGVSHGKQRLFRLALVFPTPVGVFPIPGVFPSAANCIPHARGGVSVFD